MMKSNAFFDSKHLKPWKRPHKVMTNWKIVRRKKLSHFTQWQKCEGATENEIEFMYTEKSSSYMCIINFQHYKCHVTRQAKQLTSIQHMNDTCISHEFKQFSTKITAFHWTFVHFIFLFNQFNAISKKHWFILFSFREKEYIVGYECCKQAQTHIHRGDKNRTLAMWPTTNSILILNRYFQSKRKS